MWDVSIPLSPIASLNVIISVTFVIYRFLLGTFLFKNIYVVLRTQNV